MDSDIGDIKLPNDIPNEFRAKLVERINGISSLFKLNYPLNPNCKYLYPPINQIVIQNIVNALISNKKFYYQTLHLMNKMCLPCPFQPNMFTSSNDVKINIPISNTFLDNNVVPMVIDSSSSVESSESEIEADDAEKLILKKRLQSSNNIDLIKTSKSKKLKITSFKQKTESVNKETVHVEDVFEKCVDSSDKSAVMSNSSISSKLNLNKNKASIESENKFLLIEPSNETGFGKIISADKIVDENVVSQKNKEPESEEIVNIGFISKAELERNRLTNSKLSEISAYKNYDKGEKSQRLYIKNVSKKADESHLKYIYGRYINFDNEIEVNAFDIRLMKEGRMKGQAFVTLPNEEIAAKALEETNGYILIDKPIIVQYARSAKLKS